MKCTDKIISVFCIGVLLLNLCGCRQDNTIGTYDIAASSSQYGLIQTNSIEEGPAFFASNLCVTQQDNFGLEQVDSQVAGGGGVFNLTTGQCTYGQNLFGRMYPASTTKILTCLTALRHGDLNQMITVSHKAADQTSDSSVADLAEGDVLPLKDLLYGLMLRSGNDAAIAVAEGVAGSEEAFADLMNQEALAAGATHTHFVTPHGLHDDAHYTTVYDMYLIFAKALSDENFREIISTATYTTYYQGADGSTKEQTWHNTNQYLLGSKKAPAGFTVIGGKTGTTYEAGYCLVLYSKNDQGQEIISIIFYADCTLNLYYLMNQLLYTFGEAPM